MLRHLFCVLLTFQQIFSIHYTFLPVRLRTIMAVFGLCLFIVDSKSFRISRRYISRFQNLILCLLLLFVVALLSIFINNNYDPFFIKFSVTIFISFASAYCYIKLLRKVLKEDINFSTLIKLFVEACILQCLLSLLIFVIPSFRNLMFGIVAQSEMDVYTLSLLYHPGEDVLFRFIPVGYNFWLIGTTFAVIIFFLSIISAKCKEKKQVFLLLLCIFTILIFGACISRTSLIGLPFFLLYIYKSKTISFKTKHTVYKSFIGLLIIAIIASLFLVEKFPVLEVAFERGFSMFYDYKETEKMPSVVSMTGEAVVPTDLTTWIIGDALMADPEDPGASFYKGVDIGFLRIIFGVGILGLIIYSCVQIILCRLAGFSKNQTFMLFVIYCAFMCKGLFCFDLLLSPLIMSHFIMAIPNNRNTLIRK